MSQKTTSKGSRPLLALIAVLATCIAIGVLAFFLYGLLESLSMEVSPPMAQDSGTALNSASTLTGRIVFASTRDGRWSIYTIHANGSGLTRLTAGLSPQWSPDRRQIIFGSEADGLIYGIHPD